MEVRTMLEPSGDDSVLIETVKNIVTRERRHENEEDFFLVPQVQEGEYSETNVEEITSNKHQTEETFVWTDLCRICANANDHLIPIFEGEGAERDLYSKILKYLPIHVSENDTLPLQLCYHCASTLLAWHELSEGCLNAERKLLEMQDALQSKHQYYNSSLDNLEVSTSVTTTTAIASNISISQSDQQIDGKNNVHTTEEISKPNRWEPQMSSIESTRQDNLRKDDRSDEKGFVDIVKIQPTLLNKTCMSSILAGNFKGRPILQIEIAKLYNIKLDDLEKKSELRKNRAIKSQKSTWQDSKQISEQRAELARSKVTDENGSAYYKCGECGKILSSSYSLMIHRNIHTGERPYACPICASSFRSLSCVKRHVRDVHDGVKNFACDTCGRRFASNASRNEHKRTHAEERPHMCEFCGKSFKQRASLHVHQIYHSQDMPYRCSMCDRGFKRKYDLDKHAVAHCRQKYTCNSCGMHFRSKVCADRHQRVHADHLMHVCDVCGIKFSQERYLKMHSNRHKTAHAPT